jgi:hypothetical protein
MQSVPQSGHSNVLSELNSFVIVLSPFRQFHALSERSNITPFSLPPSHFGLILAGKSLCPTLFFSWLADPPPLPPVVRDSCPDTPL